MRTTLPTVAAALLLAGCDGGAPATAPEKPVAAAAADPRPPRPPPTRPAPKPPAPTTPAPKPATQINTEAEPPPPPARPAAPEPPPEALPAAPTAPGCTLVPLNPEKTLFAELSKEKKIRRVFLVTEVCLREGPLELLLCKKETKEHEAIVRMDFGTVEANGRKYPKSARQIHNALVAAGVPRGTPVQYVNPATNKEEFKPPGGVRIGVTVHYKKDGKLHTHPAQEWVWDPKAKKPMGEGWVFAGSIDTPVPDEPKAEPFYGADGGDLIAVSNFPTAILDVPFASTDADDNRMFEAKTDRIPPKGSKVWLILEPVRK